MALVAAVADMVLVAAVDEMTLLLQLLRDGPGCCGG